MTVLKTKILVQTLDITQGGQYATGLVRLPANAHTVTAVGITTRPIVAPFEMNLCYFGVGPAGQRTAAWIASLQKNFIHHHSFEVNALADQKVYYAQAQRLGIPVFEVNGLTGGFLAPSLVRVVDGETGVAEDYYLWESTNTNLGRTVVTVNQSYS